MRMVSAIPTGQITTQMRIADQEVATVVHLLLLRQDRR